jgi:hypothetical protein
MARCGYCGTSILFGGVQAGPARFCNNKCHQNAYLWQVAQQIPAAVVERQTEDVFRGHCPQCRGPGPAEVHKVHRVWSAILLTNWSTTQELCCRSCATKSQVGALIFSMGLGWWGFPWGLVLTPIQMARNIMGIFAGPDFSRPSADLRKMVQVMLAARMVVDQRQTTAQVPPVISK